MVGNDGAPFDWMEPSSEGPVLGVADDAMVEYDLCLVIVLLVAFPLVGLPFVDASAPG